MKRRQNSQKTDWVFLPGNESEFEKQPLLLSLPNCPQIIYAECRMELGSFQIGLAMDLKATPKETAGWPLVVRGPGPSRRCGLGAGRDLGAPELTAGPHSLRHTLR